MYSLAMPTKQQFNKATGGLISIDDDDDVLIETTSSSRIWRVYSGQLQGTEPAPELVKLTVKHTCAATAAASLFFWAWALSNIVNKVGFLTELEPRGSALVLTLSLWFVDPVDKDLNLGDPDLGFLAFVCPLVVNLWGWQSTREGDYDAALRYSKRFRLAPYAHALVACAYSLGAFLSSGHFYFRVYCSTFAVLWLASAVAAKNLSERWYFCVMDRFAVLGMDGSGSTAAFKPVNAGGGGGVAGGGGGAGCYSIAGGGANVRGYGAGYEDLGNEDDDDDDTFVAEL